MLFLQFSLKLLFEHTYIYFLHKNEIIYKTKKKKKTQEGLILNRQNTSCSYIGRNKQCGCE